MSKNPDAVTRRNVLKTTGTALATLGGAAVAAGPALALPPLTVQTDPATNVCSCSATLNGYLEDLGDNDFAEVRFRWGKKGDGFPSATAWQPRSETGSFSEEITGLDCTTYEFFAEARAGQLYEDSDDGDVLEFTVSA